MVRNNDIKNIPNNTSKKEQIIKHSKKLKEKKDANSDDDSDYNSESDLDEYNKFDVQSYRKLLSKLFPSKLMQNKVNSGEKLNKIIKTDKKNKEDNKNKEDKKNKQLIKQKIPPNNNFVKKNDNKLSLNKDKVNIIFTIEKNKDDYYSDDEYQDSYSTENEDEEVSTDESNYSEDYETTESSFINDDDEDYDDDEDEDYEDDYEENDDEYEEDEEYESDDEDYEDDEDYQENEDEFIEKYNKQQLEDIETIERIKSAVEKEEKYKKHKLENNVRNNNNKNKKTNEIDKSNEKSNEMLEELNKILKNNPNDKSMQKCINIYKQDLKVQKQKNEQKQQKQKEKNLRIFKKILRDKNTMNDSTFYQKLDCNNQIKIIKELRKINEITRVEKPYRISLLDSDISLELKSVAMKKINSLRFMEPGSGEFYKNKNWVDTFMRIPFNKYEGLPISINDGVDKCHEFMENAQNTLNNAVYGLNDAKMQIMQMLGQLLANPKAIGNAIAIHGPPGTGKTSLVKEGISKILNRPFTFIALGGATDSSFLEGHGYTYEGSTWGKIVQILIESKCMNPVIYFDELDKISDTPRGEEIVGILTHLTDTSQNSQFHDKYFTEIKFDLSKCLFIFSYNNENKVNSILKDRMYRIKTKSYSTKDKTIIANNYLLPKICEQVQFHNQDIIINNDVISFIIENYCDKEDGVRNLKRCLEIIYTKLNLYRLMKPGANLFEGELALTVQFPFTVTKNIVEKLIKKEDDKASWHNLYC